MRRWLGVLAPLAAMACAHVAPTGKFRSVETRPIDDGRVVDDFENHRVSPVYGDVTVIESDDERLEVVDGTLQRYRGQNIEVIGSFEVIGELRSPFYPSDYLSVARKVWCWPQVPLMWLTLGIWTLIPSSWFCWSKTPDDREHWLSWVKQMADSAGGNLAVVTFGPKKNSIDTAKGVVVRVSPPTGPVEAPLSPAGPR